jgi:YVTN family beta-propeller protein
VVGSGIAVGLLLAVAFGPAGTPLNQYYRTAALTKSPPKCSTGSAPSVPGYDPANQDLYIPNFNSGTITVLKNPCVYVGNITLPSGAHPSQATFDPDTDYLWVTDWSLNQVYLISNLKIVSTIPSGAGHLDEPFGVTSVPNLDADFSTSPGGMAVANFGSNSISLFDSGPELKPWSYDLNIPVGKGPSLMVYAPVSGLLFVANTNSNNVTEINGSSDQTQSTVAVGSAPIGIAFDYYWGMVYVADSGGSCVSILFAEAPFALYDTVCGFSSPHYVAYDQTNQQMFVTNYGTGDVSVFGTGSQPPGPLTLDKYSEPASAEIDGIEWDGYDGQMFLDGSASDVAYVLPG